MVSAEERLAVLETRVLDWGTQHTARLDYLDRRLLLLEALVSEMRIEVKVLSARVALYAGLGSFVGVVVVGIVVNVFVPLLSHH